MKRYRLEWYPVLIGAILLLGTGCDGDDADDSAEMTIQSSAFGQNQAIPIRFTKYGGGKSPPLSFSYPPKGTQSLVVIMDEPDHITGTYTHWLVWGLPPKCVLSEDAAKYPTDGMVVGLNDAGETKYLPPEPPAGKTNRFVFSVYALDKQIKLDSSADRERLDAAMAGHILAMGQLVGLVTGR